MTDRVWQIDVSLGSQVWNSVLEHETVQDINWFECSDILGLVYSVWAKACHGTAAWNHCLYWQSSWVCYFKNCWLNHLVPPSTPLILLYFLILKMKFMNKILKFNLVLHSKILVQYIMKVQVECLCSELAPICLHINIHL